LTCSCHLSREASTTNKLLHSQKAQTTRTHFRPRPLPNSHLHSSLHTSSAFKQHIQAQFLLSVLLQTLCSLYTGLLPGRISPLQKYTTGSSLQLSTRAPDKLYLVYFLLNLAPAERPSKSHKPIPSTCVAVLDSGPRTQPLTWNWTKALYTYSLQRPRTRLSCCFTKLIISQGTAPLTENLQQ